MQNVLLVLDANYKELDNVLGDNMHLFYPWAMFFLNNQESSDSEKSAYSLKNWTHGRNFGIII